MRTYPVYAKSKKALKRGELRIARWPKDAYVKGRIVVGEIKLLPQYADELLS